ncbi:hypothetical protein G7046_g9199 [Stylonectria norvegica]|nr:hypothetical protein G7046_g9199 [Stylonectria norvegica]
MAPTKHQLKVERRTAEPTPLVNYRNFHAVQGAIYRGDRKVVLENQDEIPDTREYQQLTWVHGRTDDPSEPVEYPYYLGGGVGTGRWRDENAKDGIHRVDWEGFKLEFIKTLAAGGFGAATLWEATFENGAQHKIVIKRGLDASFESAEEREWHQRYAGNDHVVQPFDLHQAGQYYRAEALRARAEGTGSGGEPVRYEGRQFDMAALNVVGLEFVPAGDMYGLMKTATMRKLVFPTKVLWELWECLLKGVAAVAYQPFVAKYNANMSFEKMLQDGEDGGRDLMGFLRLMCTAVPSHDVHHDLEEQNILVGDVEPGHMHGPLLKLHDFGGDYSYRMQEAWKQWGEKQYWNARMCPKSYRLTPEQVHQDWDDFPTDSTQTGTKFQGADFGDPFQSQIAGRYGSWTNVFRIADVLIGVATKIIKFHPFTAKPYTTRDGKTTANTYAWRIMDPKYDYIDDRLRDVLCRCQFERPADRPDIIALLMQMYHRKALGFSETDEESVDFWRAFFSPQPPAPVAAAKVPVDKGGVVPDTAKAEDKVVDEEATRVNSPDRVAQDVARGETGAGGDTQPNDPGRVSRQVARDSPGLFGRELPREEDYGSDETQPNSPERIDQLLDQESAGSRDAGSDETQPNSPERIDQLLGEEIASAGDAGSDDTQPNTPERVADQQSHSPSLLDPTRAFRQSPTPISPEVSKIGPFLRDPGTHAGGTSMRPYGSSGPAGPAPGPTPMNSSANLVSSWSLSPSSRSVESALPSNSPVAGGWVGTAGGPHGSRVGLPSERSLNRPATKPPVLRSIPFSSFNPFSRFGRSQSGSRPQAGEVSQASSRQVAGPSSFASTVPFSRPRADGSGSNQALPNRRASPPSFPSTAPISGSSGSRNQAGKSSSGALGGRSSRNQRTGSKRSYPSDDPSEQQHRPSSSQASIQSFVAGPNANNRGRMMPPQIGGVGLHQQRPLRTFRMDRPRVLADVARPDNVARPNNDNNRRDLAPRFGGVGLNQQRPLGAFRVDQPGIFGGLPQLRNFNAPASDPNDVMDIDGDIPALTPSPIRLRRVGPPRYVLNDEDEDEEDEEEEDQAEDGPRCAVMQARAVSFELSSTGVTESEGDFSGADFTQESLSTNATSWHSSYDRRPETPSGHFDWHYTECARKWMRNDEPEYNPLPKARAPTPRRAPLRTPTRPMKRVQPLGDRGSKVSKQAPTKERARRNQQAQRTETYVERNFANLPVALQNIVVRGRALESYLDEASVDKPKEAEQHVGGKKRKRSDEEQERGKKRRRSKE